MLTPIAKEHELICPNCACVLGKIDEYEERNEKLPIPPSLDIYLLGSAMENNVKFSFRRTPEQTYEERTLRNLINITKKYALPERFAYETFKQLKKNKRGFRSEKEPLKQLLQILSKDENYVFIHKMRAIKSHYESIINN